MRVLKLVLLAVLAFASAEGFARYGRDQPMTVATLNGVQIAYRAVGAEDAPPVLMIMGLTGSHRLWGEDLVNGLLNAGYRVVLFDNRDTGESARLDELGTPTLWWELMKSAVGFPVRAPYSLSDMAADGVAVLDALEIDDAHIVGASMGGMIAQVLAAEHSERTRSLVSIMSTTGAPHLPEPEDQAAEGLLGIAESEGDAAQELEAMGIYPEAMPRQLMAIISAGDRTEQVGTIAAPTLVLHGAEDTLVPPPHGAHTHETIAGSSYVVFDGMGHDMPPAVVPAIVEEMVDFFQAAD